MQFHHISVSLPISDQFLRDVLCTAVEGGSNYWAMFEVRAVHEGEYGTEYERVLVLEIDDEANVCGKYEIGLPQLREGIQRILTVAPDGEPVDLHINDRTALFEALVSEPGGDAGQVDADLADIILQVSTLGNVVYG